MKKSTAEWAKKAEADRLIARKSGRSKTPLHDGVCFHCQQCVEKYLKAIIEEIGLPIPRTHDLDRLALLLLPHYPEFRSVRRGLVFLTTFAVATRYPGEDANKRQAKAALRWSEQIREMSRTILKI